MESEILENWLLCLLVFLFIYIKWCTLRLDDDSQSMGCICGVDASGLQHTSQLKERIKYGACNADVAADYR